MKERNLNIIEGCGLFLILISFSVQLIESSIKDEIRETQFYQTQDKLDKLWMLNSAEYSKKHPELTVTIGINFEGINKDWKYYSQDKDYLNNWKKNVFYDIIAKWRIWIFIIGSLLVIIPKLIRKPY